MHRRVLGERVVEVLELLDPFTHLCDALESSLIHEAFQLLHLELVKVQPIEAQLLSEAFHGVFLTLRTSTVSHLHLFVCLKDLFLKSSIELGSHAHPDRCPDEEEVD